MSEYYSKEVLILDNSYTTSTPNLQSRAQILVDYGVFPAVESGIVYNGEVYYYINSSQNKITYSFTLTNSTLNPPPLTVSWTYDRTGNYSSWKNLDYADPAWSGEGNNPFTPEISYVQNGNEITYTCSLAISSDASVADWKDLVVKLQVDPYQEGTGPIVQTPSMMQRFFVYNYETPPSGIYFNENLENTNLASGTATLSSSFFTWENISSVVWEVSDDNKATWTEAQNVEGGIGNPSATSSQGTLEGNELSEPIQFTNRSESLQVSYTQFVEDRFYRLKIITN